MDSISLSENKPSSSTLIWYSKHYSMVSEKFAPPNFVCSWSSCHFTRTPMLAFYQPFRMKNKNSAIFLNYLNGSEFSHWPSIFFEDTCIKDRPPPRNRLHTGMLIPSEGRQPQHTGVVVVAAGTFLFFFFFFLSTVVEQSWWDIVLITVDWGIKNGLLEHESQNWIIIAEESD